MKVTIFMTATGQVLRVATVPVGMATVQLQEGEDWIEGNYPDDKFYIDGFTPVAIPEQPSEHHRFNYTTKQWEDPRTLDDLRLAKREQITKNRDAFEFGGFDWNGYRFDSNAISQQRIQGSAQMAMAVQAAGQPFSIDWTLADNSVIALDGNQMLSVGLIMGQHISSAHSKSRLLKQQVDAAQSAEEISSIAW